LKNIQVLLKSRPEGAPSEDNFEIVEGPVPEVGEGGVLRRALWLSVDPYMRARMSTAKSYAEPATVGEPMVGGSVSEVVASNNPRYAPGDIVVGFDGWQSYAVSDGKGLRKLDPTQAPPSYALGVLGMPGLTAYVALLDFGKPKEGETVVVSAAAGAVGSIAGQIAKVKGCRVIGLAGSDAKCDYVTSELGFDECINYKTAELKTALPDGIDIYFDNVGGAILDAALRKLNVFARIPLVGLISQYNDAKPQPGPNLGPILSSRATLSGMIVTDHAHRFPDFIRDMAGWVKEGKVKLREDVIEGIENTPRAFLGLFTGENLGKRIVKVG